MPLSLPNRLFKGSTSLGSLFSEILYSLGSVIHVYEHIFVIEPAAITDPSSDVTLGVEE